MVGGLRNALLLAALLTLAQTACNIPLLSGAGGEAVTPQPTEAPSPAPAATPTIALPTEVPSPTAEPLGPPIPHYQPDQLILITAIRMVSPSLGWGIGGLEGAQDHVFRTLDGGTTWQDVTPPEPAVEPGDPAKAALGAFLDAQVGRVVYYPLALAADPHVARVWVTEDGGASWTASRPIPLDFLGSRDFPPLLRFADAEHGWLMAMQGAAGMHRYPAYLLHTSDGGRTWETLIDPYQDAGLQSCNKTGLYFLDGQTGWVTVDNCPVSAPELTVTADGGRTWQARPLPAPASRPRLFDDALCEAHSPQLLTASIGAVGVTCRLGLDISYVYVTQDGGANWATHLYPGGSLVMLNPRVGFALSRRIYQTQDGGITWIARKVVTWDGQFSWVDERTGWAVARSGEALALVKTGNAGQIWDLLKPRTGP